MTDERTSDEPDEPTAEHAEDPIGADEDVEALSGEEADAPGDTGRPADDEDPS